MKRLHYIKRLQCIGLLALLIAVANWTSVKHAVGQDGKDTSLNVVTLYEDGGRVSWSPIKKRLAFDAKGEDGYYDIYTMNRDGSDIHPLTVGRQEISNHHIGQPAWHPSGEYLAIQVENPKLAGYEKVNETTMRYLESPGIGVNNDIWIMSADGKQYWQVTRVANKLAVLHPQFSPNGRNLVWAEAISYQRGSGLIWAIRLADFAVVNGNPVVSNVRTLRPGDQVLYETHGFSPDGRKLIFSATPASLDYFGFEIYLYDIEDQALEQLTDDREWDEHAHFTPDGRHIVWMSSRGIEQSKKISGLLTDFWVMRADGSHKRRLTRFNDPTAREYLEGGVVCGDLDFEETGTTAFAYLILKADAAERQREAQKTRTIRIDIPRAEFP